MKYRQGFVSNSSSSSFVVLFPHMPVDMQDLHRMLFPEDPLVINPWSWEDTGATTLEISARVWGDIDRGAVPTENLSLLENLFFKPDFDWYTADNPLAKALRNWRGVEYPPVTLGEIYDRFAENWRKDGMDLLLSAVEALLEEHRESDYAEMHFVLGDSNTGDEEDWWDKVEMPFNAAWEVLATEHLKPVIDSFQASIPEGGFLVALEYSDHDRVGSVLDHGGVFKALPHIRIPNH